VWSTSIGLGGASSSAVLAGAYCGGGHVDLLKLDFWDVVESWVFCGFSDGGESLSGWLVKRELVLLRGLG
jgi:hypothetical protein